MAWKDISDRVQIAVDKGFLKEENEVLSPTELGWRFSNEVQAIFLP
jgi:coproporphyrinogen III oxidase-like Fe-S oxidoreductase